MSKADLNTILTILGGMVLLLGLNSKWLERSPVPATLIALVIGILLGPEVLDIIDLTEYGEKTTILEVSARITLGIGLMGVALRIPKKFPRQN